MSSEREATVLYLTSSREKIDLTNFSTKLYINYTSNSIHNDSLYRSREV